MKKFLAMGAAALVVAIFTLQQALAWVTFNTGIGANLGYQSGGNTLLWGLYRNGQPGGPDFPCEFPLPGCAGTTGQTQYNLHAVTPGQTQSRYAPAHKTGVTGWSTYSPYYSPRR